MTKIDFSKECKELYSASNERVSEVMADRAVFLCVAGQGTPGGEAFAKAIEAIYNVAYTVKFAMKHAGELDFAVSKLECVYDMADPAQTPMTEWKWRLLVRIPEEVTAAHIKAAQKAVKERKGLDTSAVKRMTWREGRALQTMHVGPYDRLGETYQQLEALIRDRGYAVNGPGHEIYISDPRRVAPEKLKTIVRFAVRKAGR